MIPQRSDEWFQQRAGRFTGSEIHLLMGKQGLDDTERSYAFQKACEIVFGLDPTWNVETWDMRRGTMTEPEAFEVLRQIMAREFLDLEECSFFPYGANAGATPDGIVRGKPIIAEIKCPKPLVVFKLIESGIKESFDGKGINKDHYDQMQTEMLCTNSELCYYFNYCTWQDKPKYHLIKVHRNEERIDLIKQRIIDATKERDDFAQNLLNNKQF